ncbi:MAG: DNA alkylation repair protein [Deltaproteobacteria bacterium]|nr:DNA alkylation repair protein [Deltaproteobacteria bacterium]
MELVDDSMSGRPSAVQLDAVGDLQRRLGGEHTDAARAFWGRRLPEDARFRGVALARVRAAVHAWWREQGFAAHPTAVGKHIALALIEQPDIEDKLAGVLVLREVLGPHLRPADLHAFAQMFAAGHLAGPYIVDWFCVKVLARLLAPPASRAHVAREIAAWRVADTTWQRRAACVAFVGLASGGDAAAGFALTDLVLAVCAHVVWSPERFDQTAVGWVLRELARGEPARAEAFYRRHALLMSRECARIAVAKYDAARRVELLGHWRRATSLRL